MPSLGENNIDLYFHSLYTWYLICFKKKKKDTKKSGRFDPLLGENLASRKRPTND